MVVRATRAERNKVKLDAHHWNWRVVMNCQGTPITPPFGSPAADVVVIVDSPAYVIRRYAWNLFMKMLRTNGMQPEQIYVTVLLKGGDIPVNGYRESLMASARVMMRWEVDVIRPKVIVPMGELAEDTWRHNRGRYAVVPVPHPQDAMTRASVRKLMAVQMAEVKNRLDTRD
jgi:uracil-DNA glycosylase